MPRRRVRLAVRPRRLARDCRAHGFGVTAWLVVLVLVPVTMVAVLSGAATLDARSAVTAARAVNRQAGHIAKLVSVRDGVLALQSVKSFDVRFEELGFTRDYASTFIGVDLSAREELARRRTDEAIAVMGDDSPIRAAAVDELFAALDAGRIGSRTAEVRLAALADAVDASLLDRVSRLDLSLGGTTHEIVADLRSLRAVLNIDRVAALQGIELSSVWFPSPTATAETVAAALARLGGETAEYRASSLRVHEFAVAPVVAALSAIEDDPGAQAFDAGVAAALAGRPIAASDGTVDTAEVAAIFRGFLERTTLVEQLVTTSTAVTRHDAQQAEATARTAFWAWIAGRDRPVPGLDHARPPRRPLDRQPAAPVERVRPGLERRPARYGAAAGCQPWTA